MYRLHQDKLDQPNDTAQKLDRLVELNIQEQVYGLTTTSIVQNAWSNGKSLQIHVLVYDIKTGFSKDLRITKDNTRAVDDVYRLGPVMT